MKFQNISFWGQQSNEKVKNSRTFQLHEVFKPVSNHTWRWRSAKSHFVENSDFLLGKRCWTVSRLWGGGGGHKNIPKRVLLLSHRADSRKRNEFECPRYLLPTIRKGCLTPQMQGIANWEWHGFRSKIDKLVLSLKFFLKRSVHAKTAHKASIWMSLTVLVCNWNPSKVNWVRLVLR